MTQPKPSASVPQHAVDVHAIPITFFDDRFAFVKHEDRLTLPDLAEEIRLITDTSKEKLPWLKLARFGDVPSGKNSMRHDKNVLAITGVEIDYDAKETSFDQAVERLATAGLRALVYTSASHKPGVREKWRVLCPTSEPLPPGERTKLVATLNGVLGGGIDPASFVLSQSYYYGSVKSNPDHRVEVIGGDFINLRPDLEAGAIGKPAAVKRETLPINRNSLPINGESPAYSEAELDAMLDKSQYKNSDGSGNWHPAMVAVTASLVSRGWGDDAIRARAAPFADGGVADEDVQKLIDGARAKWGIPDPDVPPGARLGPEVLAAIATDAPAAERVRQATLDDFQAYLPSHHCVYMPTRAMWPVASVDDLLPKVQLFKADGTAVLKKDKPVYIKPSQWLAQNKPLEQMTWMPGEGEIIRGRLVLEGGWVEQPGARCLNLYRPPTLGLGNALQAGRWIDHVERLYGDDALHLIKWLAFKVQFPGVKINHSVVLGGAPGIGKDTLLEPVKRAIGPWNMAEIAPKDMLERFNGYGQSVILRISEARDLGEMSRYEFYERTKVYGAAPPDVLMIDEKNLKKYAVPNVCNMVITTNYKTNGIYLPADDRRHFVAWCDLTKETFAGGYWPGLWSWYEGGGCGHVAAYLSSLDLSDFDPKASPPLTAAFHAIVDANQSPESAEMSDALARIGNPAAVTLAQIQSGAEYEFQKWMSERRNQRQVIHRLEDCGYEAVRSDAKDRLWVVGGRRQMVYAVAMLSTRDKLSAVSELCNRVAPEKKVDF
jgi:hypothetical protein